jgi:hypothetical protein
MSDMTCHTVVLYFLRQSALDCPSLQERSGALPPYRSRAAFVTGAKLIRHLY